MSVNEKAGFRDRRPSRRLVRWLVVIVVVVAALELLYLAAANALLSGDRLSRLVNKKPEKTRIEWTGARTWLPGVVTVEGFSITGQTKKVQWYLEADRVRARISLLRLPFKTLRLRAVRAENLDVRLRHRLDAQTAAGETPSVVRFAEHFPEIPGLTNPPEPKPEDLYPPKAKKTKRGWTIDLGGVKADGAVRVAVDRIRLEGEGSVAGAMVYKLRDSILIRHADLGLGSTSLVIDSELASDDLTIDASTRWRRFAAKGAKPPEIFGGISGRIAIAGNLHAKASVPIQLVPGLPISGTGHLDTILHLRDGRLMPGSTYSLESERFTVGLLGLTALGSATLTANTSRRESTMVTDLAIDLRSFAFVDPDSSAVGIGGSELMVSATWQDLSLAERTRPSMVEVSLPDARIENVHVLGQLLPPQEAVTIDSGTGTVSGQLSVDGDGTAKGRIDLISDDVRVIANGVPMQADLSIAAHLDRGDLARRTFEISSTTVRVTDVRELEAGGSEADPWWAELELEGGTATLTRPLSARGAIRLRMHDTRPVVAIIGNFTQPPKWLSLMPNIKNVEGTMNVTVDHPTMAAEDVAINGDSLEVLGSLRVVEKRADGKIYVKYKGVAAGIGLDGGKSSIHLMKPRQWFDSH